MRTYLLNKAAFATHSPPQRHHFFERNEKPTRQPRQLTKRLLVLKEACSGALSLRDITRRNGSKKAI